MVQAREQVPAQRQPQSACSVWHCYDVNKGACQASGRVSDAAIVDLHLACNARTLLGLGLC